MRSTRHTILAGLLAASATLPVHAQPAQEPDPVHAVASRIEAGHEPVAYLGQPNGQHIIEIFDYACLYCRLWHQQVEKEWLTRHPNTRIDLIMAPIIAPSSFRLAEFAIAAGLQGKFAAAHDFLFKFHPVTVDQANALIPDLIRAANLEPSAFQAALTNGSTRAIVTANRSLAAQAGAAGTPTFIINGRRYPGLLSSDEIEAAFRGQASSRQETRHE